MVALLSWLLRRCDCSKFSTGLAVSQLCTHGLHTLIPYRLAACSLPALSIEHCCPAGFERKFFRLNRGVGLGLFKFKRGRASELKNACFKFYHLIFSCQGQLKHNIVESMCY
eukprot:g2377.t1